MLYPSYITAIRNGYLFLVSKYSLMLPLISYCNEVNKIYHLHYTVEVINSVSIISIIKSNKP